MIVQIKPWGNSQGIRLSKEVLQMAGFRNDEYLEVRFVDDGIVLSKSFKHRTLEERAEEFGGKLGVYEEMNFGEPVGREGRYE